jgi:hypothetical protein
MLKRNYKKIQNMFNPIKMIMKNTRIFSTKITLSIKVLSHQLLFKELICLQINYNLTLKII